MNDAATMILGDWVRLATARLERAGVDSPRLDAQVLAAHALGKDRTYVLAHPEREVLLGVLEPMLIRREAREPLAYIVGQREFYGRMFQVSPDVLVPRADTEILVERALLAVSHNRQWTGSILDIGTGSGAIAVTLACELPMSDVTAVDISGRALRIAMANAARHQAHINFVRSDLYEHLPANYFDLVVSNPPYVSHADDLEPDVREYEPSLALYADANGLAFYRRLAAETPQVLVCRALMVEIGLGQRDDVIGIFSEYGWRCLDCVSDLSGIPRVLTFETDTDLS